MPIFFWSRISSVCQILVPFSIGVALAETNIKSAIVSSKHVCYIFQQESVVEKKHWSSMTTGCELKDSEMLSKMYIQTWLLTHQSTYLEGQRCNSLWSVTGAKMHEKQC